MSDTSLALTVARAALSLVLVLALLVLCLRVLAKRGGFSGPARAGVDVEVLGRRQLSKSASVQVVRVGEEVLVLGVTDSQISTLHHLSGEDLPADEEEGDAPAPATPPSFVEALRAQGHVGRLVAGAATGAGRARGGRRRGRHAAPPGVSPSSVGSITVWPEHTGDDHAVELDHRRDPTADQTGGGAA